MCQLLWFPEPLQAGTLNAADKGLPVDPNRLARGLSC